MNARSIPWRRLAGTVALALAAALPAATLSQSGDVIHLGAAPDDTSFPLIYAAQSGMYAKAGLNVDLQKFGGGALVAAALLGGSLDIGKTSALLPVQAHAKGLPLTVLGNVSVYNSAHPDLALIVTNDSGVKTAKDLPGKTLAATALQDMNSISTFAWLEQQKIDSSTVKFIEMPASATLAAMQQGRVAGSTLYEPFLSMALATGKVHVLGYPYDAIGKRFSGGLIVATSSWATAHRPLVERFLRVTYQAAAYVASHENERIAMLSAYAGVDPATISNTRHDDRAVAIAPSDIQPVIDAAAKYHIIPAAYPASELICECAIRP